MKNFVQGFLENINNNSKLVFKILPAVFFASLLISTVMVVIYPTFFTQKAASNNQEILSDVVIATMGAGQLTTSVQGFTKDILTSSKASRKSPITISKERQDTSATRKKYMKELITKDPTKFLENAVPNKVSTLLAPKIKENFEQEVIVEGDVQNIIGENLKTKQVETELYVNSNQGRLRVYSTDKQDKGLLSGTKVKINGYKIDKDVATASVSRQKVKSNVKGITTITDSVNKKIAVILFDFQNKRGTFWPTDEIKKWLFNDPASLNGYYTEVSKDQITFSGDIFGPITVPLDAGTNCGSVYDSSTKAKEMITATGVNLDSYDLVAFDFPSYDSCWAAAWADIGGKYTWFNGSLLQYDSVLPTKAPAYPGSTPAPYYVPMTRAGLAIHEIGHNLGMHHANSYVCKDTSGNSVPVDLYKNCTNTEYGDPFDVMGNYYEDPRHINAYHTGQMGWLPDSATLTTNEPGNFTIYPLESNTGNTSLRIPAGIYPNYNNNSLFYYLEFRKNIGGVFDRFELSDPVVQGISIRLGFDYGATYNSLLVDTTPGNYSFYDSSLKPGQTFDDNLRGIKITPRQINSDGSITISVDRYTPDCVSSKPTVEIYNNSSGWGKPNEVVNYGITITNNDSLICGATTYTLLPDFPSGWSQVTTPLALTVNPQETIYFQLDVSSSVGSTQGAVNFTETVQHPKGVAYNVSVSSVYNVYNSDSGGPTVNLISPIDNQTYIQGPINIMADVSDETQVSFANIFADDWNSMCEWNSSPYVCTYDLNNLSLGTHIIHFVAYDVLNNITQKDITIQVVSTLTPSPSPSASPTFRAGDVNRDGTVNIVDIGILVDNYSLVPLPYPRADLNSDGIVNIIDIGIVIDNYGL